jgi:hypothetical protein
MPHRVHDALHLHEHEKNIKNKIILLAAIGGSCRRWHGWRDLLFELYSYQKQKSENA